jgi:hypothetical protein
MAAMWLPLTMRGRLYPDTDKTSGMEWYVEMNYQWLTLSARLKPGRSIDEARSETAVLLGQLAGDHPQRFSKADLRVAPLTILGRIGIMTRVASLRWIILAAMQYPSHTRPPLTGFGNQSSHKRTYRIAQKKIHLIE